MTYFLTNKLRKNLFRECLKSPVSEDSSRSTMVNGPKHCSKLNDSTFTIFIDRGEEFYVEKVPLGDMKNLRTVC